MYHGQLTYAVVLPVKLDNISQVAAGWPCSKEEILPFLSAID